MEFDLDLLRKEPATAQRTSSNPRAGPLTEGEQPLLGNRATLRLMSQVPAPVVSRFDGAVSVVVYFSQNHFLLDAEGFTVLEKLGKDLRFYYEPHIVVDGHASTEGTASYNVGLSERRRQTVIAILTGGLSGKPAVSGKAWGEAQPAVAEDARDPKEKERQRSYNRRAEIRITPSRPVVPERKPDLRPRMEPKPETAEERLGRIIREKPPEPPPKRSPSEMFWRKFNEKTDDILRKAGIPEKLRSYIRDAARSALEKGVEKILDEALDKTGLSDQAKRALKQALKAAGETPL